MENCGSPGREKEDKFTVDTCMVSLCPKNKP
jgi:hypothetical protein